MWIWKSCRAHEVLRYGKGDLLAIDASQRLPPPAI